MNPLGIFEDRYAKAYVKAGDEESSTFTCEVSILPEALAKDYGSDAHFCLYHVEDEQIWPRLKKTSLSALTVKVRYLAVDWDIPGHEEWSVQPFEDFFAKVDEIAEVFPEINNYSALYTTLHGAHFVWTLDRAVDPHVAEGLLKGITAKLIKLGLKVDELCDWTRLMRCPSVVRDAKPTKDEPFYLLDIQDRLTTVGSLPFVETRKQRFDAMVEIDDALPTATPLPDEHPAYKMAKQRLVGRDCYEAIFGSRSAESWGAEGHRNTNIFKYVGQATGLLMPLGTFDATKVFRLFVTAAQACGEGEGKESPTHQLWRACKTSWEREAAQVQEVQDEIAEVEEQQSSIWDDISNGFLEWSTVPGIDDAADARAYLQDKLILITPAGGAMVMQPNGYYDRAETSKSQLVSRIRQIGMAGIVVCYKAGSKKPKAAQEILDVYGFPVTSVAAGPEYERGSIVIGMDSGLPTAVLPMFQRNPRVTPKYDADVDMWLRKICKDEADYSKLLAWIGHSLDFSVPIAALALVGPGGIGKKLLMLGLAECFLPPRIADFANMVAGFGDVLLETPWICANEGFPQNSGSGKRIADLIRELVAGDPISINRKFKTPVQIQANFRVVITANNDQCLTNLYAGQDLTQDDRRAITQRIVHIHASDAARIWLRSKGGLSFTGAKGHRWVSNQSGGQSDFVVARHFLWLHENRTAPEIGSRFAVEGNMSSGALVDDMALASGVAPKVIESLLAISNATQEQEGVAFIPEDTPELSRGIYVTTSAVKTAYRALPYQKNMDSLTDRKIRNVLMSLCDTHKLVSIGGMDAHWFKLNVEFIFHHAQRDGSRIGYKFKDYQNDK